MDNTIVNESLIKGKTYFPAGASTFSGGVDSLFQFIYYGSIILFVGIILVTTYFVWKYRRREGYVQSSAPHMTHNTLLELAWTVPPLILCMFIFYWGFQGFLNMSVAPKGGEEIHVVARKWMWQFEYKNGTKSLSELVVPVDTPVNLVMSSEDVIHSFYVPNFRLKRDVLPNRYTKVWFNATREGTFQIFCAEFCGDGHSQMLGSVRVVSAADYQKWLADGGSSGGDDLPPEKRGETLYQSKGCVACHSTDGSPKSGPSWKGLYGSTRQFVGGGSATADDNYLRESIEKPQAHVVNGFAPVMPSFAGLLNEKDIAGIIAYIKTLK
jgi:cytochrome c oxidase subunit 2